MTAMVSLPTVVENPLVDPLRFERRAPSCSIVIFGANGDLAKRKLMPALYRLSCERRIPPTFAIIGNSRTPMTDEAYRAAMRDATAKFLEDGPLDTEAWDNFARSLFYVPGDLQDSTLYQNLDTKLGNLQQSHQTTGNTLFYLSTQPSYYGPVVGQLGAASLQRNHEGWRRIIVEKPFGRDLATAGELNNDILKVFEEDQVYRIDHYLGKETVQNILAFRFGNGIFEPLWNRRYINHIQVTAAESIGVEGRGAYYQEAGALRDMIQNHLIQVMATIGMEPPAVFTADAVRDERAKFLRSIRVLKPSEVSKYAVAGQYGAARIGTQQAPGFREESGVKEDAQTDTYAAVTLFVDNWRWAGVPFYLRSGKRLPKRVTDIAIYYNTAPHSPFAVDGLSAEVRPNLLLIRIQPEEGISVKFLAKQPGSGMRLRPVSMDFNCGTSFGQRSPSAYETLLLDAMIGDATLYTRQDMVNASWAVVQPILDWWGNTKFDFPNYAAGTWGPVTSDEMLAQRGHRWRVP